MADCLADLILRPGRQRPPVQIELTVVAGVDTLTGGDEPGEVDGHPVPAGLVRELAYALGLLPRPDDPTADTRRRPTPTAPSRAGRRRPSRRRPRRRARATGRAADAEAAPDEREPTPRRSRHRPPTPPSQAAAGRGWASCSACARIAGTALAHLPAIADRRGDLRPAARPHRRHRIRHAATCGRPACRTGRRPCTHPPADPASARRRDTARLPPRRRRSHRFVRARDRRCRFPGCRAAAIRCDLDHNIPWPAGATSADNLCCLCRHHHRLSHQAPGWTMHPPARRRPAMDHPRRRHHHHPPAPLRHRRRPPTHRRPAHPADPATAGHPPLSHARTTPPLATTTTGPRRRTRTVLSGDRARRACHATRSMRSSGAPPETRRTPEVDDLRGSPGLPGRADRRSGAHDLAGADARGARVDPATVAGGDRAPARTGCSGSNGAACGGASATPTYRNRGPCHTHRTRQPRLITPRESFTDGGARQHPQQDRRSSLTAPGDGVAAPPDRGGRGPLAIDRSCRTAMGTLRPCCRRWTTPRSVSGTAPRSRSCPRPAAGSTTSTSSRCPTATPAPTCCSPPRPPSPRSTPQGAAHHRVRLVGARPRRGARRPRQLRHDPRPAPARPRRPAGRPAAGRRARPSPPRCRRPPTPPTPRSPTPRRAPSSPSPGPAPRPRSPPSTRGAPTLADVVRAAADGARVALEATTEPARRPARRRRRRRRRRRALPRPRRAGHDRDRRRAGPPAAAPAATTAHHHAGEHLPHQPPAGPGQRGAVPARRHRRGRRRPPAAAARRARRQPRRRRRRHPDRPRVERPRARRRRRRRHRGRHRGRPARTASRSPRWPRSRRRRRRPGARAVVAVVASDGLAELFAGEGVRVVTCGPDGVTEDARARRGRSPPAPHEVVVLPNDAELIRDRRPRRRPGPRAGPRRRRRPHPVAGAGAGRASPSPTPPAGSATTSSPWPRPPPPPAGPR